MVIKLTPSQIPKLWEAIKYAVVHVNNLSDRDSPLYLCRLLHALLSSKAQCFVRINEDRELLAICITKIIGDEITGEKSIFMECLYSFESASIDTWRQDKEIIMKFAKKEKCSKITAYSSNPRLFDIVEKLGFSERYRCFIMEV